MGSGDAGVHRARRHAITLEHPEVTKLTGADSVTQYYAYGLFLFQVFFAYVVRDSYLGAIVLGTTISPYAALGIFALIHEVSHSLVFSNVAYNRLLGIGCNMAILAPVSEVFRQHHGIHHIHLGDVHKDVDVPGEREMKAIGNSSFLKTLWLAFSVFILPVRSLKKQSVKWNTMMVINWVGCVIFSLVVFRSSRASFLYLLLGTALSQSMHPANARQVQRHIKVYKTSDDEDIKQTGDVPVENRKLNTFSYYGKQNAFTMNAGYHIEHHDFSNIPWTRLPKLRAIAGDKWYPDCNAYESRGTSEILAFITNPKISLADYAGRS